VLDLTTCQH